MRTFSHRLIDVLSHRLYRYHRGGGGGVCVCEGGVV